eukprot:scaffold1478_cov213-Alexandrium_tamarense.AAC.10
MRDVGIGISWRADRWIGGFDGWWVGMMGQFFLMAAYSLTPQSAVKLEEVEVKSGEEEESQVWAGLEDGGNAKPTS